jgi:cytidine deaminase
MIRTHPTTIRQTTIRWMNNPREMEQKIHSFIYHQYESADELAAADRELLEEARTAVGSAYAPYSHYEVGAAVRLVNGIIKRGSNQENIAFPSGLCAERVALFAASSENPGVPVEAIAITARAPHIPVDQPVTPCGACRQAISEYEMLHQHKIRMILSGETGKILVIESIEDLLPLSFKAEGLRK